MNRRMMIAVGGAALWALSAQLAQFGPIKDVTKGDMKAQANVETAAATAGVGMALYGVGLPMWAVYGASGLELYRQMQRADKVKEGAKINAGLAGS